MTFPLNTDAHSKEMCRPMLSYEQRCNIISIIYIKQEGVTLATFMDISLEEDTIHCQDFQGLYDCIHSCRKLSRMKNPSQKGGI